MKKENLLKQENGEALVLRKAIERQYKRLDKLSNEIEINKNKLQEICIHNDTKEITEYVSGSYYDREEYKNWNVCQICGTKKFLGVTYGSFG